MKVTATTATAAPGNNVTVTSTVTCPAGKVVTGGGFIVASADAKAMVSASQVGAGESWTASLTGIGAGSASTIKAFVVCA